MRERYRGRIGGAAALVLLASLVFVSARPASARVFVGGAIGVPLYPYSPYPAYYYGPYYAPYPYAYPYYYNPAAVPPGWEPGHWEWRQDAGGRSIRVWVPAHLR